MSSMIVSKKKDGSCSFKPMNERSLFQESKQSLFQVKNSLPQRTMMKKFWFRGLCIP